jgi:hypothetical protein
VPAARGAILHVGMYLQPLWRIGERSQRLRRAWRAARGVGSGGSCGRRREEVSMRIEPVERDQARPVVRRIYDAIEQRTGMVSPFFKMLGNKPELLRAFNQLYGVVWAEGALAAKLKELAYLRVSILNGCGY